MKCLQLVAFLWLAFIHVDIQAFVVSSSSPLLKTLATTSTTVLSSFLSSSSNDHYGATVQVSRRRIFMDITARTTAIVLLGMTTTEMMISTETARAADGDAKFVQTYDDFIQVDGGAWSYRDVTPGKAGTPAASTGDRVVFDWSGYTIGYFGRPFQAKGGPQGGAFDKELDYERTVLGSGQIVPVLEQALMGMQQGGVRQVIVPYGPLSYPADDSVHDRVGPKPSTFSGQRALNFVLDNPRVDRTLLFNVKVIRVDKPNGKGGFLRG